MAKVAMMTSGLTRRQTYEEVLEYSYEDPDKIKYPNRTAKYLRNTFQLSHLDGMGQALFEQQQIDEMKDKLKDYQLREIADQNETSARTERAIQQGGSQSVITEGTSGSSNDGGGGTGVVRNVVGGVITAAPYVAGGVGNVVSGVGNIIRGAVSAASYAGSLLPTGHDEAVESDQNDRLNEHAEREANRRQLEKRYMSDVRSNLDEVRQQQERNLPPVPPMPFAASSSSYGSIPSSPAPTHHYIGDSPAPTTPAQTVRSSPELVQSSPSTVRSSPARTEGELRAERRRKKFGY